MVNEVFRDMIKGQVVLLNAPMGCGKDVAVQKLQEMTGCGHLEFKMTLHNIAMAVTGLFPEDYFAIYNDRSKKELPQPEFFGMSPREMLIWISEDVCKPKFGKEFFGMPAANQAAACLETNGAAFSDSGFAEEVFPIARRVGAENVHIIRFTRFGAKFADNDSRNFLKQEDLPEGVNFHPMMSNDGDLGMFCRNILLRVGGQL